MRVVGSLGALWKGTSPNSAHFWTPSAPVAEALTFYTINLGTASRTIAGPNRTSSLWKIMKSRVIGRVGSPRTQAHNVSSDSIEGWSTLQGCDWCEVRERDSGRRQGQRTIRGHERHNKLSSCTITIGINVDRLAKEFLKLLDQLEHG